MSESNQNLGFPQLVGHLNISDVTITDISDVTIIDINDFTIIEFAAVATQNQKN